MVRSLGMSTSVIESAAPKGATAERSYDVYLPLVALLLTAEVQPFMLMVFGALFIWHLVPMMKNNAPRRFDPLKPPDALLG